MPQYRGNASFEGLNIAPENNSISEQLVNRVSKWFSAHGYTPSDTFPSLLPIPTMLTPTIPAAGESHTSFPFLVRPVQPGCELDAVLELRHRAYSRRTAYQEDFAANLRLADELDESGKSTALGAFLCDTGQLVGTVRLTLSTDVPEVMPSFVPVNPFSGAAYTFVDRFAVAPEAPSLVGPSLMKALWLWTQAKGSEALAALAMRALTRHYAHWAAFKHLGTGEPLHVKHHLREPVYLVGTRMVDVLPTMRQKNPGFAAFLEDHHPHIRVLDSELVLA